jgi:general secretion pathway protein N
MKPQAPTSTRTPWGWAAAGLLLGLLLTLLLQAPARWVAQGLSAASAGQIQLLNARGTLWNGEAQLHFSGGADSRDSTRLPGALQWQLRPRLWGLQLQLQADCCTPQALQFELHPRWGGLQLLLADAQSGWPAALLTGLGTPWNTLQASGQLMLSSQALRLDLSPGRLRIEGSAQLDVLDLSSRLSTLQPLGSYRLRVEGGADTRLTLSTLNGKLLLQGEGQWIGGRLRFQGQAEAAPSYEPALSNLLNIIGRRQGAQSIITLG